MLKMLSIWDTQTSSGGGSMIRIMLAEVVATVGPELARRIIVHIA